MECDLITNLAKKILCRLSKLQTSKIMFILAYITNRAIDARERGSTNIHKRRLCLRYDL